MHKFLIVINPVAGNRNNTRRIEFIRKFFEDSNLRHKVVLTSFEVRAEELVRNEFSTDFTHLVVCGGDGTINEAINGLSDYHRPVGLIPIGTGNDFIKNLQLPETLQYLLNGNTMEVTMGLFNGRRFINGLGAGFDGQIIFNMNRNRGILKGKLAYLYNVVKILGTYRSKPVSYRIDDRSYQKDLFLILVANGTTFGGGFMLAPDADISSSNLDVCIIKKVKVYRRFLYLYRLKKGQHKNLPEVEMHKASRVEIASDKIHSQVDGEYSGKPPFSVSVAPEKIKILVPK